MLMILVYGSDISVATSFNESALSSLYALISFPSTVVSSFPNDVTYTLYTPERERIQYNIDNQFYTLLNFMYDDSPEAYCRSN